MDIELRCANKKCMHEWIYKNKRNKIEKDLITCPKCHYRNQLKILKKFKQSSLLLEQPEKKEYADYEDPRCNVIDKTGREWIFPKPVLKEGGI